jgi:hypothetical protein
VASTAEVEFDPDALIAAADSGLYRAKAGGRNQVIPGGIHALDLPKTLRQVSMRCTP